MQIQIKQPDLRRIVEVAGAAAMAGKSTLPILSHIHIAVNPEEKTIRATGTNLETWAEATAPLLQSTALEFGDDAENGEVIATASARQFIALVSSLPATSTVSIEFETRGMTRRDLNIEAAGTKSKLPGMAWEEYPLPPDVEAGACVTLPTTDLIGLVDYVSHCVSKDQTRPVLTTIYFEIGEGKIKTVGTNTHTLGVRSILAPDMTGSLTAMVPTAPLLAFLQVARKAAKDTTVHMEISTGLTRFTLGDARHTIRLMEGQYPNYQRVIPTAFDREVTADRQEMIDAISRALIAAADNANRVVMDTDLNGTMKLSGESASVGEISSVLDITSTGEPTQIAMNGVYLKQTLSALEGTDGVRLKMSEPLRPCVVVPSGAGAADFGDALTVVMPMQVI